MTSVLVARASLRITAAFAARTLSDNIVYVIFTFDYNVSAVALHEHYTVCYSATANNLFQIKTRWSVDQY